MIVRKMVKRGVPIETGAKFYEFDQNNTGGSFVKNENAGISIRVIIEAVSRADAVARAKGIGLYFDGHGDCSCCGDRWHDCPGIVDLDWYDGDVVQEWVYDGEAFAFVHYLNGDIEGFYK